MYLHDYLVVKLLLSNIYIIATFYTIAWTKVYAHFLLTNRYSVYFLIHFFKETPTSVILAEKII